MTTDSKQFAHVGYSNLSDSEPSFVVPLFTMSSIRDIKCPKGKLSLYYQDAVREQVTGFVETNSLDRACYDLEGKPTTEAGLLEFAKTALQQPVDSPRVMKVGDPLLYGFLFSRGDVTCGSRLKLDSILRKRWRKLQDDPFLLADVHEFLNQHRLLAKALKRIEAELAEHSQTLAQKWYESSVSTLIDKKKWFPTVADPKASLPKESTTKLTSVTPAVQQGAETRSSVSLDASTRLRQVVSDLTLLQHGKGDESPQETQLQNQLVSILSDVLGSKIAPDVFTSAQNHPGANTASFPPFWVSTHVRRTDLSRRQHETVAVTAAMKACVHGYMLVPDPMSPTFLSAAVFRRSTPAFRNSSNLVRPIEALPKIWRRAGNSDFLGHFDAHSQSRFFQAIHYAASWLSAEYQINATTFAYLLRAGPFLFRRDPELSFWLGKPERWKSMVFPAQIEASILAEGAPLSSPLSLRHSFLLLPFGDSDYLIFRPSTPPGLSIKASARSAYSPNYLNQPASRSLTTTYLKSGRKPLSFDLDLSKVFESMLLPFSEVSKLSFY